MAPPDKKAAKPCPEGLGEDFVPLDPRQGFFQIS